MGGCYSSRGRYRRPVDASIHPLTPTDRGLLEELDDLSSEDMITALKRIGVKRDLNKPDRHGFTLLHHAAERGEVELCKTLSRIIDVDLCIGPTGTTPLILAAGHGYTECAEILLDAGADVNATDTWSNTALFKSTCYNLVDSVKLLLQRQADPNLCNQWGGLPLQYAAKQGYGDIVLMLLEYGADVNLHLETSTPFPLAAAASTYHSDAVDILLDHGANVNYSPNDLNALCHVVASPMDLFSHHSSLGVMKQRKAKCVARLLRAGSVITLDCLSKLVLSNCEVAEQVLQALPYVGESEQMRLDVVFNWWLRRDFDDTNPHAMVILSLLHLVGLNFFPVCLSMDSDMRELNVYEAVNVFNRQPRSLENICQLAVRKTLRPNVACSVDKLPVPKVTQRRLLCLGEKQVVN